MSGDAKCLNACQSHSDVMVAMIVAITVMRTIVVSYNSFLLYSWLIIISILTVHGPQNHKHALFILHVHQY